MSGFAPFVSGDIFVTATELDGTSRFPTGKGRVRQFDGDFKLKAEVSTGRVGLVSSLNIGPDGVLWVMDAQARGFDRYAPSGKRLPPFPTLPAAGFGSVVFAADGTTLIADHFCAPEGPFAGTGHVHRIDGKGTVLATWHTETNGGIAHFLGTTHMALVDGGKTLIHLSETGAHVYAHDLAADRRLGAFYTRADPPPFLFGLTELAGGDIAVCEGDHIRRIGRDGSLKAKWDMGGGRGWSVLAHRPSRTSLWACDFMGGTLAEIDGTTGAVIRKQELGLPQALAGVAEVGTSA